MFLDLVPYMKVVYYVRVFATIIYSHNSEPERKSKGHARGLVRKIQVTEKIIDGLTLKNCKESGAVSKHIFCYVGRYLLNFSRTSVAPRL